MENDDWLPRVDEPMEEYLKTDRYRKTSSVITFSDFKGQEEANYAFWRHLTPAQRLELHTIMVTSMFADEIRNRQNRSSFEIVFTEKVL
jgi:hypothetical protein